MTEIATIEGEVKAKAKTYIALLKAHEKLVIILVLAGLSLHFYNSAINTWVAHDQRQSTAAAQLVQADNAKSQQLQSQLAQIQQQIGKQNAQLSAGIQARDTATKSQQAADANQTPQEQLARLKSLLGVGEQDLQSSPVQGSVVFDATAALKTEQTLEELPALRQDNADLHQELNNDQQVIAAQSDVIAGTKKELADEKSSHQDDVKTFKAENKREFLRGFKWGAITGAVGGEVIRIIITHSL